MKTFLFARQGFQALTEVVTVINKEDISQNITQNEKQKGDSQADVGRGCKS